MHNESGAEGVETQDGERISAISCNEQIAGHGGGTYVTSNRRNRRKYILRDRSATCYRSCIPRCDEGVQAMTDNTQSEKERADAVFEKLLADLRLYREKKDEEKRIEEACKAYGTRKKNVAAEQR